MVYTIFAYIQMNSWEELKITFSQLEYHHFPIIHIQSRYNNCYSTIYFSVCPDLWKGQYPSLHVMVQLYFIILAILLFPYVRASYRILGYNKAESETVGLLRIILQKSLHNYRKR